MNKINHLICVALITFCSGCMTYRNIPTAIDTSQTNSAKRTDPLEYKIEGNAMFAGPSAIRNVIANEAPFETIVPAEKETTQGNYLSIQVQQLSPSIAAVVFGYISCASLTILPFWSTNDGAALTFTLYKDGKKITAKEYVVNRGTFVWMPMLPLIWVNLLTPSEEDAFQAATRDFLKTI